MKLLEQRAIVARTFNLGPYESLRLEAGAVAMPEDGETAEQVRAALLTEVRANLREQYLTLHPKAEKPPRPMVDGDIGVVSFGFEHKSDAQA